jgi:hypothetical protein
MWKKPEKPQAAPRSGWAAVSIVPAKSSCEAARALKNKRFLATQAPRLPLADCSQPLSCTCSYKKYADRRAGPRREDESTGVRRYVEPDKERRGKRGGRRSDDEPSS